MKTKQVIRLLIVFSCIAAAILLIGALRIFRSDHNDSPGWRLLKTQDSYSLDSQQMNGTDSHTLDLTAGDVLQVTFETEKGSLHMELTAPDGTILYAGNGEEVTEFAINLSQTGAYTVTVEARRAKGKINIHLRRALRRRRSGTAADRVTAHAEYGACHCDGGPCGCAGCRKHTEYPEFHPITAAGGYFPTHTDLSSAGRHRL